MRHRPDKTPTVVPSPPAWRVSIHFASAVSTSATSPPCAGPRAAPPNASASTASWATTSCRWASSNSAVPRAPLSLPPSPTAWDLISRAPRPSFPTLMCRSSRCVLTKRWSTPSCSTSVHTPSTNLRCATMPDCRKPAAPSARRLRPWERSPWALRASNHPHSNTASKCRISKSQVLIFATSLPSLPADTTRASGRACSNMAMSSSTSAAAPSISSPTTEKQPPMSIFPTGK